MWIYTQRNKLVNLDHVMDVVIHQQGDVYTGTKEAAVLATSAVHHESGYIVFEGDLADCERLHAEIGDHLQAYTAPIQVDQWINALPVGMGPPDLEPGEEHDSFVSDSDFVDDANQLF